METDQTVYQYLTANLVGKSEEIVNRYSRRIAVFSDPPEILGIGEIRLKSKLWDYLDEAIAGGITTLYTGLSYGADSAAAELFAVRKQQNRDIRIVHIRTSPKWFSETDPALQGFAVNTLQKSTDYIRYTCGYPSGDSRIVRDRFIVDQCLHIVLILDFSVRTEDSYSWQLLEYALQPRKDSISHQVHIISSENEPCCRENTGKEVPVQALLF